MRRLAAFLIGSALTFLPSLALAQQAPASPVTMGETPKPPAQPVAPAAPASQPAAAPQPLAPVKIEAPQDPPYDPAQHGGLSFGTYIRATRGTARRSTGMMVTGIVLDVVGTVLMATGTAVWVKGNTCHNDFQVVGPGGVTNARCGAMTGHATGMSLLASGTLGLGLGLPLTIYGGMGVPRAEAGSVTPRASVALGLRGAELTLHF
jgi:hypothetical protein